MLRSNDGAKKIAEQFVMDFNEVKKIQSTWKTEIADTIRLATPSF